MNPLEGLLRFTGAVARPGLSLLKGWAPWLSLTLLAVLAGLGMLWTVRRFTDQAALRATKRRLRAHVYELRLFADEPVLLWRAQWRLLRDNLRYLGLMLRPALVLALPMLFLLMQLDCFYGRAPLPVGQAAVVTVQMKGTLGLPELQAPAGIVVETPAVRVESERQLSWRVRPLREVSGRLRIVFPNGSFEKAIEAGQGPRYVSARRVSSLAELFAHAGEPRLPAGELAWIEVRYPWAGVRVWGLQFHWLVWFVLVALAATWVLKKRLRVTL